MGILKWLGLAVIVLLVAGVGLYGYLGGFAPVKIERGSVAGMEIVYTAYAGSYSKIAKSWARFQKEWTAAGLKDCDAVGIYLDPPGTPDAKLRWILGCRIDALSPEEKGSLRSKMSTASLPASDALLSVFPYKNDLSYMLGPMKVYPEMMKRAKADNVTPLLAIELYGPFSAVKDIHFTMPVGTEKSAYQSLFNVFSH